MSYNLLVNINSLNFDTIVENIINVLRNQTEKGITDFVDDLNDSIFARPNLLYFYTDVVSCVFNFLDIKKGELLIQKMKEKVNPIFLGFFVNSGLITIDDILKLDQKKQDFAFLSFEKSEDISDEEKNKLETALKAVDPLIKKDIDNKWIELYKMFANDDIEYLKKNKIDKNEQILYPFVKGSPQNTVNPLNFAALFGAKNIFVHLVKENKEDIKKCTEIAEFVVIGGSFELLKYIQKEGVQIASQSLLDLSKKYGHLKLQKYIEFSIKRKH